MKGIVLFGEGVHGIAFHPRFAENRLFYLSYSQNEPRRTVISEMKCTTDGEPMAMPETERILMEIPQPLTDHWVLHGKILRIDVNHRSGSLPYGIPSDNPFVQEQAVRHEIYAMGFRNPWGLSFDPHTIDPIHACTRMRGEGICIVGGQLYRGKKLPQLQGAFVFADWGFGTVWGLLMDPGTRTPLKRGVLHRKTDLDGKFNPTLVTADAEGEIILLSQDGALHRLEAE